MILAQTLRRQRSQRLIFLSISILLISALLIINLTVTGGIIPTSESESNSFDRFESQMQTPAGERERLANPREGITVVTDHREGNIVALNPNGTLLYHNDSHDGYWDVDPSPEGSRQFYTQLLTE